MKSESDPDIDNMAKPYVDALQKGRANLIVNDRLVQDLRILKVDVNDSFLNIAEVDDARLAPGFDRFGEFVLLMIDRLDWPNQVSIAAEFAR